MKRQKRFALPFMLLGLLTWTAAFFVLKGFGTRVSTFNKLPGEMSEGGGLFEQYGITPNQLDEMIHNSGSFGGGWDAMALGILMIVGLFQIITSFVYLFGRRENSAGSE